MVAETSSYESAVWRYLLAVVTLVVLNFKNLPNFNTIRSNIKPMILVGFVGLFFFNFFFFKGMVLTTPINAVLIIGLNPALTLIFSVIILKTKMSVKQVVGILIALCGVIYLLFKGDIDQISQMQFSYGDLLIMLSSVFFALHHVWVKKYSGTIDNSQFSLMTAATCLVALCISCFTFTEVGDIVSYSSKFWVGAIGIGVFGTGIAYWFWYKGIALSSAPKAAMFINIVPLSGAVFSIVLGDEVFFYHFISAALIVIGILIMQIKLAK